MKKIIYITILFLAVAFSPLFGDTAKAEPYSGKGGSWYFANYMSFPPGAIIKGWVIPSNKYVALHAKQVGDPPLNALTAISRSNDLRSTVNTDSKIGNQNNPEDVQVVDFATKFVQEVNLQQNTITFTVKGEGRVNFALAYSDGGFIAFGQGAVLTPNWRTYTYPVKPNATITTIVLELSNRGTLESPYIQLKSPGLITQ
ncbi:MAG: hypothetical protein K9L98_01465 [Candidatus Pacebacteria bacterium]|nr:hypothetical protein [Candidatus Paceibacterota bacterium]MCF7862661.1 hypothetical protein [Candidatus Paceibacterota bacterium]